MKFRSPTSEPLHIALTTGHTAVIPPATDEAPHGAELPQMFHREAIARGALPEGTSAESKADDGGFDRKDVIRKALQEMLDGNNEGDFKQDGNPDLRAVNKRVGFQVARDEVDALWEELTAD